MSVKKVVLKHLYAPVSHYFSIATIFRPLRRGHERSAFVVHKDTPTYTLEVKGWEELDAYDLDVFLSVLHLAGKDVSVVEVGGDDVALLNAQGLVHPSHFDTCAVSFTRYELLKLLGKGVGKKEYTRMVNSLMRLAEVRFKLIYKTHEQWMSSNLWGVSEVDDKITVTLNRELGVGLVNNYSRIWFEERNELSNAGRILHLFLSGSVREGNKAALKYPVDTLVEYVYGADATQCSVDQLRDRREQIDQALTQLSVYWPQLNLDAGQPLAKRVYEIKRPSTLALETN
jgi:hypothetical protein